MHVFWFTGLAHVTAILLLSIRIVMLLSARQRPKFRLVGSARALKVTAIIASVGTLLIVLLQLNARIALDPSPLVSGRVAPFEVAGTRTHPSQKASALSPPVHFLFFVLSPLKRRLALFSETPLLIIYLSGFVSTCQACI